jgi:hypothetical protein
MKIGEVCADGPPPHRLRWKERSLKRKHRDEKSDTVSDVAGARTGLGSPRQLTPAEVRRAQLVVASAALGDAEREADLPEVLDALGIKTRNGRLADVSARVPKGLGQPGPGVRGYRKPGKREPSGRLSRSKGIY